MHEYRWDKNEIIRQYVTYTQKLISDFLSSGFQVDKNTKLYQQYLSDMLFFEMMKLPCFSLSNLNIKTCLNADEFMVQQKLTTFEKEQIKRLINKCLNVDFRIKGFEQKSDSNINFISECFIFLKQVSNDYYNELNNSITLKRLFIDDGEKEMNFCGIFYNVNDDHYYHINNDNTSKTFLSINHEIIHGIIASITHNKYDHINENFLYREIGSILMEMYSNEYLFMNKLICYVFFVTNLNEIFLINIYDQIEVVDVLFSMATMSFEKKRKNVKEFIDVRKINNPNYNISITELMEIALHQHLIYLYSTTIALSIYSQHQEDPAKGMLIATEIMKEITPENEDELLASYNINFEKAINDYIKLNNKLLKRGSK